MPEQYDVFHIQERAGFDGRAIAKVVVATRVDAIPEGAIPLQAWGVRKDDRPDLVDLAKCLEPGTTLFEPTERQTI